MMETETVKGLWTLMKKEIEDISKKARHGENCDKKSGYVIGRFVSELSD